ncbi:MAG: FliA/WhiG family RNA polymerase sigma factor [Bacteroidetes bacterium]|jgi:RNA polymerase sigma factor for flagellar operon FliA|nr:FliA/WhiG family RNA polymerase sigma factor [Bacteroidota bacterium]
MTTQELWKKYSRRRSAATKKELVLAYLNLVKFAARAINLPSRCVFNNEDLMSIGIIGLNEAIERFDPARGVKFETFASQRIRGIMLDEIRKVDWLPRSVRDKYKKASKSLSELNMDTVNGEKYAKAINMSVSEFEQIKGYLANADAVSLTRSIGEDMTLEDVISGDSEVIEMYEDAEMKEQLVIALKQLPERERMVVTLYYYEELTFKEIGKTLGISESRVSQIHSEVIAKLKALFKKEVEL